MHSGTSLQQRLSADCEAYFSQASAVQGAEQLTGTSRCGPERGAAIIFLGRWEGCSYSLSRSDPQTLGKTTCLQTVVLGTHALRMNGIGLCHHIFCVHQVRHLQLHLSPLIFM